MSLPLKGIKRERENGRKRLKIERQKKANKCLREEERKKKNKNR